MSHFLIDRSFKYDASVKQSPFDNGYIYDEERGYWREKLGDRPLMHIENEFKPQTKKADVETGEDRKGE